MNFIKKHKKLLIVLLILVVLVVVFSVAKPFGKKQDFSEMNQTTEAFETISRQTINDYVSLTGTIAANDSQTVYANLAGSEVLEIRVDVGTPVNKGDVVAVLDSSLLEEKLAVAQKELGVQQAKTGLQQKKAQRNVADTNYDAMNAVGDSQTALTQAQTDYSYACADVGQAKEDLAKAQDEYEEAKDEYEYRSQKYKKVKKTGTDLEIETAAAKKEQAESAMEQAEQAVKNAERAVGNAEESAERTYRNVSKAEENVSDTLVNEGRKMMDAEDNLTNTNLDASIASDNLESQILELERQIEKCTVTAPITGIVTSVSMEVGDEIANDNNEICVIQDTSSYEVVGTIDEYDVSSVSEGMKAVIVTEASDDVEMTGKVTFVSPTPKAGSSSVTASDSSSTPVYPVEIAIDALDPNARIGMTAQTNVILASAEDVLTVPYDCITQNDQGQDVIYVIDEKAAPAEETAEEESKGFFGGFGKGRAGKNYGQGPDRGAFGSADSAGKDISIPPNAKEIVVTKGLETDYYTEISGEGLEEGMKVVILNSGATDEDDFEGMVVMGPGF